MVLKAGRKTGIEVGPAQETRSWTKRFYSGRHDSHNNKIENVVLYITL